MALGRHRKRPGRESHRREPPPAGSPTAPGASSTPSEAPPPPVMLSACSGPCQLSPRPSLSLIDFREKERSVGGLPYTPRPGTEPTTQVRALTGDRTHHLLLRKVRLQQPTTEPHRPGPRCLSEPTSPDPAPQRCPENRGGHGGREGSPRTPSGLRPLPPPQICSLPRLHPNQPRTLAAPPAHSSSLRGPGALSQSLAARPGQGLGTSPRLLTSRDLTSSVPIAENWGLASVPGRATRVFTSEKTLWK